MDSCSGVGRQARLPAEVVDLGPEPVDSVGQLRVLADADFDAAQGVEHGGVIAAAVETADLGKREAGRLAGEEDRDLARAQRRRGAAGADELGPRDAEGGRDVLLDLLDRRVSARGGEECGISSAISFESSGRAVTEAWAMTLVRAPCSWRTLALMRPASSTRASPSPSPSGRPASRTRRRRTVEPGGEVRRLDRDRQPPLEAVAKPLGEGRELARHAVRGEHDLAAALVEGVEGVEELLFGVLLALEELDVVDEQHVEVAVALLEAPRRPWLRSASTNSLVKDSAVV